MVLGQITATLVSADGQAGDATELQLDERRQVVEQGQVTIYRDQFGIPHIFGSTLEATYYGHGYATGEDTGMELARACLHIQGREAEFFGRRFVARDFTALWCEHYEACAKAFPRYPKEHQTALTAFAAGYRRWVSEKSTEAPEWLDVVNGPALVALLLEWDYGRAIEKLRPLVQAEGIQLPSRRGGGSNEFVVGPSRTADGSVIVSGDPHTPWGQSQRTVHLKGPDFETWGIAGGSEDAGALYQAPCAVGGCALHRARWTSLPLPGWDT